MAGRDFGRISYNTGIVNSARVGYSSTLYSADTWYNTSLTFDQVAGTMAVTMNGAEIGSTAALFYGEKPSIRMEERHLILRIAVSSH